MLINVKNAKPHWHFWVSVCVYVQLQSTVHRSIIAKLTTSLIAGSEFSNSITLKHSRYDHQSSLHCKYMKLLLFALSDPLLSYLAKNQHSVLFRWCLDMGLSDTGYNQAKRNTVHRCAHWYFIYLILSFSDKTLVYFFFFVERFSVINLTSFGKSSN